MATAAPTLVAIAHTHRRPPSQRSDTRGSSLNISPATMAPQGLSWRIAVAAVVARPASRRR